MRFESYNFGQKGGISYIYVYIHHHISPKMQYSNVHISGTTGPNFFKYSQNRQNKSTTSWISGVSIGVWEPLIYSM